MHSSTLSSHEKSGDAITAVVMSSDPQLSCVVCAQHVLCVELGAASTRRLAVGAHMRRPTSADPNFGTSGATRG